MLSWAMDTVLPFLGFAIATSITPGPNNVMVAASAATHGVRATLPHMFGIAVGFAAMILLVGLGLAEPLTAHPGLHRALRWIGIGWMVVLAWKIMSAPPPGADASGRRLMGFGGAAAFQWINPKAWLIAVAAVSAYTAGAGFATQVVVLALIFLVVTVPCVMVWALLGAGAGTLMATGARLRAFNAVMALLLLAAVVPMAFE